MNQPLETGADVAQPREIQIARQIVAAKSQPEDCQQVARCVSARLAAASPPCQRNGNSGSENSMRYMINVTAIHPIAVGELDDDGLARKATAPSVAEQQPSPCADQC